MAEWNAFYQNEDAEEGQEEGEQYGGKVKFALLMHVKYKVTINPLYLVTISLCYICIFISHHHVSPVYSNFELVTRA